jgi:glycosyltransferase involved in cell wall biosynthesis
MLDAYRRVRTDRPALRLKIVGCTPDLHDEGVDVVGYLDKSSPTGRAALLDLYARATCFCLLSQFDAFPNVLLEAGYMGVPVVSNNDGSRPEVVQDGVTGILVSRHDPDAVADAIDALVGDPVRAQTMGAAAQARVEKYYTWETVAGRILAEMGFL